MNFSNFFSLPPDNDNVDAFDHQAPFYNPQPTPSLGFCLNQTASGLAQQMRGAQGMVHNSLMGLANSLGPVGNEPEYAYANKRAQKQNSEFNQGPSFSASHSYHSERVGSDLSSNPSQFECYETHQTKPFGLGGQMPNNIYPNTYQVDINFASKEKLSEIPGINHAMAYHIVDYRQRYGPYQSFDVLRGIAGIGEFELAAIRDHCVINPPHHVDSFNTKKKSNSHSFISSPRRNNEKSVTNLHCSYISVREFQACNVKPQSLSFVHVQINGLFWKISKIQELISCCRHKPDVICVSETSSPRFDEKFNLPFYTFRQVNSRFMSDGVAIYAKSSLLCKERKDLNCSLTDCEDTWIEIVRQRDMKNIVVGAVCRHHDLIRQEEFIRDLKALVQRVAYGENKVIYILGDINVDWLSSKSDIKAFREDMLTLGCKQLISKPTKKGGFKSLKNPILTNDFIHHDVEAGIVETADISDQFSVYCIV